MAISRVDFGGRTLIDLTNDSVTSASLLAGFTAHGADGELIRGAAEPASSGVESFNGRTGSVAPMSGDYTDDQVLLSSTMHIGGETQDTVSEALSALANNSGGVKAYDDLSGRPQINGHILTGNQTASQLGIEPGQTVMVNDLINNQTYPLKKITLSTSDPASNYVFEKGEIWITYVNLT